MSHLHHLEITGNASAVIAGLDRLDYLVNADNLHTLTGEEVTGWRINAEGFPVFAFKFETEGHWAEDWAADISKTDGVSVELWVAEDPGFWFAGARYTGGVCSDSRRWPEPPKPMGIEG